MDSISEGELNISNRDRRWIQFCKKVAKNSTHRIFHMGSVVVKGGSILGFGANGTDFNSHCERRAIRPNQGDYTGATLYVARTNGLSSHPCVNCLKAIIEAGISRVVYQDQDGFIRELFPMYYIERVQQAEGKYL